MSERASSAVPWDPRWLSRLSHDLRNELVPLRTATDLLRRGRLDADGEREMIGMIDRQTRRLVRMLDDLSEYGRALHAAPPATTDRADLMLVIDNAIGQIDAAVNAAGHTLQLELPTDSLDVRGDAARLTRLLTRLLDNAARFTPPGGRLALRVVQQPDQVRLEVADSGRGVAEDRREAIFGVPLESGDADGLGLSLALARCCARDYGGDLRVGNDPTLGGALFVLTLPRAA